MIRDYLRALTDREPFYQTHSSSSVPLNRNGHCLSITAQDQSSMEEEIEKSERDRAKFYQWVYEGKIFRGKIYSNENRVKGTFH